MPKRWADINDVEIECHGGGNDYLTKQHEANSLGDLDPIDDSLHHCLSSLSLTTSTNTKDNFRAIYISSWGGSCDGRSIDRISRLATHPMDARE